MIGFIMEKIMFRLVWHKTNDDYYLGKYATLFFGEEIIWSGYSNECIDDILNAVNISFYEEREL